MDIRMMKRGDYRVKGPATGFTRNHIENLRKTGKISAAAALALNRRLDKRFEAAERKIDGVLDHQAQLRK